MMINYSEWHTERAPQGKKVNSVEETSSLSDKIDVIMSMLVNGRSNVDPNNVPSASLVAQEENVDVNFIKSNNFNNNAYRNNSGNNYRPYPSNNGNGYGNSYGNSYNNNRSVPSGLEAMLKEFISTQTAFNKSVEEKLGKIDILAADVDLLKLKVMPNEDKDIKSFATANAIQVPRWRRNPWCCAALHSVTNNLHVFLDSYRFDNLGFTLRENSLLYASHLPLGVPNGRVSTARITPIVEKSSEKMEKKRTCYICREKGHISSFCTIGTSSNSITIDDVYSLRKDEGGNVFAKFVGAQSGVKKRTIWVAKPIVTNLLGPNFVGDQQSKT
ncbi:hypothetical protein QYE76_029031 [Lolium multiflorum]|uniref:CCHC-type domain-containing protein n=1 Tax=Lolium multiflorum TaxID=4521 RepID=A0AAD8VHW3_LOLMU|nr:hypothetical protein QYE76_029031 [Lolium multiflorum]